MNHQIRVLVADDEPYSRKELIHLLSNHPSIEVIGEADSGEQAVVKCVQLQPDVVFLDIEMPGMNGIDTAKSIRELKKVPGIVFATAYPQFAVEAFRYEAVHYLLKPFEEEDIKETVSRIQKLLPEKRVVKKNTGKFAVESDGEIIYINPNDIIYVTREEKLSKIVIADSEYEVKMTLKDLESRFEQYPFFRIHKSFLVHLDYVQKLTPWFNGAYQLELKGRQEVLSVSRNYAKELRHQLEI
ncbi:LytR/AlgR family response regulator transcription factor [Domibacillus mangrovi]|uniref:DNA-binding response regulator n=1 Tax=Domibacillus mangrovi TaxID=1714354 RepID=A0A1Q5P3C0_9BACI|nr:LytTR family DNA-binding domain-containing protein [Domibacillus mangrovi]OKL36726.1 DNA-binding response regulator [Domibacillus mangrovi]